MGRRGGGAAPPAWRGGGTGTLPFPERGADPADRADGAALTTAPRPAPRRPAPGRASRPSPGRGAPVPTVGVEEEFLLVVPGAGRAVPYGPEVIGRAAGRFAPGRIQAELFPTQVETASVPCTALPDLRADLARLRRGIAAAAREEGCLPVACGTAVLAAAAEVDVTDDPRYRRMVHRFGPIARGQAEGVCGLHVHVGIEDRDEAVQVGNGLRPWLPVLEALAANSPFRHGLDAGYASTRALVWGRWPGTGPAPLFASAKAYDDLVDALVDSGMLLDRRMVYWHARLSERYPTVEVRVADSNDDLDTVVLVAALVRGLCATLLAEVRAGRTAPAVPGELLRAAHWRAARDGLAGLGLDPLACRLRPAGDLLEDLVRRARPGLEAAGDHRAVAALLAGVLRRGGGAVRQRAAFDRRGDLRDVVRALAESTDAAEPADGAETAAGG
ncbi:glutamate--cysteine ligase [Streptomyces sp. NPDC001380]|uniref:carboxylate-amine ligase n=1 Tax=Streptomyces sp. NPDC001380 TaxID=3364566 RepID=UPI0036C09346